MSILPPRTLVGMVLSCLATFALAQPAPSEAPVNNVTDIHFGTAVDDPYRYMEDLKNPEVAAWMKAQADYTKATLARIPHRDVMLDELTTFGDAALVRVSSVQLTGDHFYYLKRMADENIAKLYVRAAAGGKERLLVDPDKLPAPGRQAQRDRLLRRIARQQVPRLGRVGRRITREPISSSEWTGFPEAGHRLLSKLHCLTLELRRKLPPYPCCHRTPPIASLALMDVSGKVGEFHIRLCK